MKNKWTFTKEIIFFSNHTWSNCFENIKYSWFWHLLIKVKHFQSIMSQLSIDMTETCTKNNWSDNFDKFKIIHNVENICNMPGSFSCEKYGVEKTYLIWKIEIIVTFSSTKQYTLKYTFFWKLHSIQNFSSLEKRSKFIIRN